MSNATHTKDMTTHTSCRYFGANIPGKPREPMNFMGGMPMYKKKLDEEIENGYQGFVMAH